MGMCMGQACAWGGEYLGNGVCLFSVAQCIQMHNFPISSLPSPP